MNTRTTRGFTLLELMVVLLILAMLATIAAPQVIKYLGRAKQDTAQVQVDALSAAVDFFHFDLGRYPSEEDQESTDVGNCVRHGRGRSHRLRRTVGKDRNSRAHFAVRGEHVLWVIAHIN